MSTMHFSLPRPLGILLEAVAVCMAAFTFECAFRLSMPSVRAVLAVHFGVLRENLELLVRCLLFAAGYGFCSAMPRIGVVETLQDVELRPKESGRATLALLRERRSIFPKQFAPRTDEDGGPRVPRSVLLNMLEAANWAPTHKMTEPWRFAVFEDDGARKAVGTANQDYYKKTCPPEKFSEKKWKKKLKSALDSSFILAIVMRRDPSERIPEFEEIASVAMSVQNMHLYCSSIGVGAYWSSGGLSADQPEVKRRLLSTMALAEADRCLGFFYVGVPGKTVKRRWPKGSRATTGVAKATFVRGEDVL
jgi:nitroreductase